MQQPIFEEDAGTGLGLGAAVGALLRAGLGLLVAGRVVEGMTLDGGAGGQVLALLLAGVICAIGRGIGSLAGTYEVSFGTDDTRVSASGTRLPGRVYGVLVLLFPLWLADRACRAGGLPLRLSSFWPLLMTAVVLVATDSVLRAAAGPPRADRPPGTWTDAARPVLAAFAVWVAALAVDGFDLAAGPWWRQALVLGVLGWLFAVPDPKVPLERSRTLWVALPLAFAVAAGSNALMLWLLTWLSTGLRLSLDASGAVGLVVAALLVTGVMWVARLPAALAELGVATAFARTPSPSYEALSTGEAAGQNPLAALQAFALQLAWSELAGAPVRVGRFGFSVGSGAVARMRWGFGHR